MQGETHGEPLEIFFVHLNCWINKICLQINILCLQPNILCLQLKLFYAYNPMEGLTYQYFMLTAINVQNWHFRLVVHCTVYISPSLASLHCQTNQPPASLTPIVLFVTSGKYSNWNNLIIPSYLCFPILMDFFYSRLEPLLQLRGSGKTEWCFRSDRAPHLGKR